MKQSKNVKLYNGVVQLIGKHNDTISNSFLARNMHGVYVEFKVTNDNELNYIRPEGPDNMELPIINFRWGGIIEDSKIPVNYALHTRKYVGRNVTLHERQQMKLKYNLEPAFTTDEAAFTYDTGKYWKMELDGEPNEAGFIPWRVIKEKRYLHEQRNSK